MCRTTQVNIIIGLTFTLTHIITRIRTRIRGLANKHTIRLLVLLPVLWLVV